MTEGKSAALQRLAVPSCYSAGSRDRHRHRSVLRRGAAATARAAADVGEPAHEVRRDRRTRGARRDARGAALAERTRAELHARPVPRARPLRRARKPTIFDDLAAAARRAADLELLRRNSKAAFYEPLVGAAAHALAAVLDRVRHGTLPGVGRARRDRSSRRRRWPRASRRSRIAGRSSAHRLLRVGGRATRSGSSSPRSRSAGARSGGTR